MLHIQIYREGLTHPSLDPILNKNVLVTSSRMGSPLLSRRILHVYTCHLQHSSHTHLSQCACASNGSRGGMEGTLTLSRQGLENNQSACIKLTNQLLQIHIRSSVVLQTQGCVSCCEENLTNGAKEPDVVYFTGIANWPYKRHNYDDNMLSQRFDSQTFTSRAAGAKPWRTMVLECV